MSSFSQPIRVLPSDDEYPSDPRGHIFLYQDTQGCYDGSPGEDRFNSNFKIAAGRAQSRSETACGCGELAMFVPDDRVNVERQRGSVLHPASFGDTNTQYMCVPMVSYFTAPLEKPACGRPVPPPIAACPTGQFEIMSFQDRESRVKNVQEKHIIHCSDAAENRCVAGELAMDLPDYVYNAKELSRLGYGEGEVYPYSTPFGGMMKQNPYVCIAKADYEAIPPAPACK
jgi:hypothetical protein